MERIGYLRVEVVRVHNQNLRNSRQTHSDHTLIKLILPELATSASGTVESCWWSCCCLDVSLARASGASRSTEDEVLSTEEPLETSRPDIAGCDVRGALRSTASLNNSRPEPIPCSLSARHAIVGPHRGAAAIRPGCASRSRASAVTS